MSNKEKDRPMAKSPPPNERSHVLPDAPARDTYSTVLDLVIRFHNLTNDTISKTNFVSSQTVSRGRNTYDKKMISLDFARKINQRINELLSEREGLKPDDFYKFNDLFEVVHQ